MCSEKGTIEFVLLVGTDKSPACGGSNNRVLGGYQRGGMSSRAWYNATAAKMYSSNRKQLRSKMTATVETIFSADIDFFVVWDDVMVLVAAYLDLPRFVGLPACAVRSNSMLLLDATLSFRLGILRYSRI